MANRAVRRLSIPTGDGQTSLVVPRFPELPSIRSIGLSQSGPAWTNAPHSHAEYELHFVRRGKGTLTAQGRRFAVASGDIYLFRPCESHGGFTDAKDPAQVLYLAFTVPAALRGEVFTSVQNKPLFLHEDVAELRASLRTLGDSLAAL
ncbi:MAG: AraC family ligand binding domain-containing protein, partial [Planctomycetes bacterium]|nr:AraC family ligand binding domain-containing protein [Planctomycetota bacterium]